MKANNFPTLIAVVSTLLLAGCSTPTVVDPTASGRDSLIAAGDIVPGVRLSLAFATLENDVSDFGFKYKAQTGKVFRQVFTGGEDAPCSLDLVNSSISKQSGDFMILATSTQIVLTVSASLRTPDGRQHVVSATGAGSTTWTIDRAMREASERAAIDLGKQVRVLLDSQ